MGSLSTRPRQLAPRSWRVVLLAAALAVAGVAGCSSDPTASDGDQALAQQLSTAEQQLATAEQQLSAAAQQLSAAEQQVGDVTAERDALATRTSGTASVELPTEVAAVLKNYGDAVLAGDGDAMLEYVTDDYTFLSYGDVTARDARADWVSRYYASFKLEVLGDPMVLGGGDTYIIATPERVTKPAWAIGFSVIRIVRVDGAWLVDSHRFTGE